jgi:hypothetical protein
MITAAEMMSRSSARGVAPDADALAVLAELVSLSSRIEELSSCALRQLASRPTVTAHLGQARGHLIELHRCLAHAKGTMAYNAGIGG